jgi:hypothetical protein
MNFLSVLYAKAGITVDGVTTLNNTATGQTPATNDNSTKLATTAYVKNQNYYPYPTGTTAQYVRGDGSLATFTQTGGGGSSVSYYLNGSVSQGTIGGNAYYEMSKTAIIGTNADFTINANGYIAQFVTDAGDPALLSIPGGNWNFEMFFSASSGGGSPSFYVELYKYDGTTLTLIASGSAVPESITGGTSTDLYVTALAVPTTTLTLTDRLAIRVYVTHSGRTITLHTQNGHLCQIITTFTTGLTALNGLTAQVQNFAVGAGGSDFNISSVVDTHTFNLPTASATKRGALSSIDWSAFDAKVDFGDLSATSPLNYNGSGLFTIAQSSGSTNGYLSSTDWTTFNAKQNAITLTTTGTSGAATLVGATLNIPNYSTDLSGYVPYTGATANVNLGAYELFGKYLNAEGSAGLGGVLNIKQDAVYLPKGNGYSSIASTVVLFDFYGYTGASTYKNFALRFDGLTNNTKRIYTLPNADGTLALTSDLGAYLPLAGGTLTGALYGTTASFSYTLIVGNATPTTKFEVYGSHSDTTARLYSTGNGASLNASLDMWASEPGVSYDGSGIGNNVNGSPFYGRRNSALGQSYIRFISGQIIFYTGSTTANEALNITASGAAIFQNSVTAAGNYLIANVSATKKGYTFNSPASNWGAQTSGIYFTPIDAVDATPTFTINLWNGTSGTAGYGTFTDVLSINGAGGAATFSSSVTANGDLYLQNSGRAIVFNSNTNNNTQIYEVAGKIVLYTGAVDRLTISATGIATFASSVIISTANNINPADNVNTVVVGNVGDTGWRAKGIGGSAAANHNWTIAHNALKLYFGISNGVAPDLASWLVVSPSGAVEFNSLAGSGSRMVVADATGVLSTQAIPTGTISGSGTTNYIAKFTSGSAVGNSIIYDNGTNVGINTSTPAAAAKLHIVAESSTASIFLDVYGNRAGFLGRVASGTIGAPGYNAINVNMGAFGVRPWNGTDFYSGGNTFISFHSSEAHALNALGGRIQFQTTLNGTAAGVERMRIENNGNVLIGTTTDSGYKLDVNGSISWGTSAGSYMYAGGISHLFAFSASNGNYLYSGGAQGLTINNAADTLNLVKFADNGNVLIGTNTDAGYKLDVNGDARVQGKSVFGNNVKIYPTSESWAEGLAFMMPTTGTWGGLRWQRERVNTDGNWYIGFTALDSTDDLVFGANNGGSQVNNIIRLTKAGNVGIGNTTPASILQVGNAGAAPNGLATLTLTGANTAPQIATKPGLYHRDAVGLGVFSDYAMSFQVNGASSLADAMFITNTGLIGIGTNTPSAKLDVAGTIGITTASANGIIRRTSVNGSNGIQIQGNINDTVSDANPGASIYVGGGTLTDTYEGNIVLTAYGNTAGGTRNNITFNNRSGTNTTIERMRITSGGNVLIGTTTDSGYKFTIAGSGSSYSVSPHGAGIDVYSTGNIAPHFQTNYTWYTGAIGSGTFRMGLDASGNLTAGSFIGAGTGLTGTASALSIGGSAATAGSATYASILSTTNQGIVGSTGLTTVSSEAQWSNFPIGYSAMFLAGQTATGAPSGAYGFFIKIANRDAGGGWGGIWTDYSGGDTYVGNTTTSSTYANWYKLLSSTNYNSYAPTLTGGGASGSWGISVTGNAATATNISNNGTVTLATATESNSIYITQPSYSTDQPVKLLNFAWYSEVWQMGNIRSGGATTAGFGIYLNGSEKFRFNRDGVAIFGSSATFGSTITATNGIFNNAAGGSIGLKYGGTDDWVVGENAGAATRDFNIYNFNRSTIELSISRATGTATFAGRVSSTAWTTSGRNYSNEWIEFPNNSGLYSPINSAHFFPNNGSYGSWKIQGTRNGYAGLEFGALTNGSVALIIQPNSNETGFYNTTYGWQFLWNNGELKLSKSTYGGGGLATVVDSSNIGSYALPTSGGTLTGDLTTDGWFINSTDTYGIKNSSNNSSFWSQYARWNVNSNDTTSVSLAFYTQYTQQFSIGRGSEGIYITNDQDAEASILCYQGAGYGGYLTGTWNVTNDLTVDGDNIVVNNSATYDTALITHKSSAVAFPNSSIWVSGMVVDAISSLYIIKFADFSIAQSQFRLYEDGKLFIYGGVFSTNSYRALTSSYVRLSGSTAPNDWFVKQSDSAGFSIVKNADTLYGISTGGTHTFSNPSNTLVTFSGSAATFSTSVSVIAGYISVGAYGLFNSTNSSYFRTNATSSYGAWDNVGSRGGYTGTLYNTTNLPHIMFGTTNGFGGLYYQTGSRWVLYYNYTDNCLAVGGTTTNATYKMYVTGAIYATGAIVANSDGRNKENVEVVENALEKVTNLRGVTYTKKDQDSGKREMGVIAQEVEPHVPEVVHHSKDADVYGVSYGNFAGLFIEAIKEQQVLINELKAEIEILKNK